MYRFHYAVYSHPGMIREKNEDNYYVNGSWKREIEQNISKATDIVQGGYLVASVCDGMGGEDLGEVASLCTAESIHEFVMEKDASMCSRGGGHDLNLLVKTANHKICEFMSHENKRSGSTITVLEFLKNSVTVMNLGDSPGFQFRDGCLKQITVDHTVIHRMIQMGQLTEEEANNHPMRHQLTQYLGIYEEEMILEPFVSGKLRLMQGDIYLICSDGLTDMLSKKEISRILQEVQSVEKKAEMLVDAAIAAGGKDNITVLLVEIGETISWLERFQKFWNKL